MQECSKRHAHKRDDLPEIVVQIGPGDIMPGVAALDALKPALGPIKGFNMNHLLKNLDPYVWVSWVSQAGEAVFVHYLDGGYTPNITQKVHAIEEDLKSERPRLSPGKTRAHPTPCAGIYTANYGGLEAIHPRIAHPTVATPQLYN